MYTHARMLTPVCTHIHTQVRPRRHAHWHKDVHMQTHVFTHTVIHTHVHVYAAPKTHTHAHVQAHARTYTHTYIQSRGHACTHRNTHHNTNRTHARTQTHTYTLQHKPSTQQLSNNKEPITSYRNRSWVITVWTTCRVQCSNSNGAGEPSTSPRQQYAPRHR